MKNKFLLLSVFAIVFAFIESAVVVYLREIFYPEGFIFPLKFFPLNLLVIEIGREISTMIVLFLIANALGKNFLENCCYFIYSFGIWDIFYYVWLKIFLNWPESFFTWDILFLVPVVWTGPVLAPVIISINMIITSVLIAKKTFQIVFDKTDILILLFAILIFFITFVYNVPAVLKQEIPGFYPWILFIIAESLWLIVLKRKLI